MRPPRPIRSSSAAPPSTRSGRTWGARRVPPHGTRRAPRPRAADRAPGLPVRRLQALIRAESLRRRRRRGGEHVDCGLLTGAGRPGDEQLTELVGPEPRASAAARGDVTQPAVLAGGAGVEDIDEALAA